MKKNCYGIMTALLLVTSLSVVGCGGKNKSGKTAKLTPNSEKDFKYTMTEDGKGVQITEYTGTSSKIIIPDTIEGLPVLEVVGLVKQEEEFGDMYKNAWSGKWEYHLRNTSITHVSFPDSVRVLENKLSSKYNLLENYQELVYVKLPAGLEKDLKLPVYNSKTYDYDFVNDIVYDLDTKKEFKRNSYEGLCEGCIKLKSVVIPEGVVSIPDSAFYKCESLEKITLPSTIQYIGDTAFCDCGKLSEIEIPETISHITFKWYRLKYEKSWDGSTYEEIIKFDRNEAFKGTSLNLTTQAKLKTLGYDGSF